MSLKNKLINHHYKALSHQLLDNNFNLKRYKTSYTTYINHAHWHRCLRSSGLRVGGNLSTWYIKVAWFSLPGILRLLGFPSWCMRLQGAQLYSISFITLATLCFLCCLLTPSSSAIPNSKLLIRITLE